LPQKVIAVESIDHPTEKREWRHVVPLHTHRVELDPLDERMTLSSGGRRNGTRRVLFLLVFLSGFAGLVYEVLWLKELGLLFGNTAHAAAATLAVFFSGLGLGSYLGGRYSGRFATPIRSYAVLEAGVGATALLYFALLALYHAAYPTLFEAFGRSPALFIAVKIALAAAILLPSSTLMGASLPVLTPALVGSTRDLGRSGILLYAVNTAGGVFGALLAGFYLPILLGYRASYALALATSLSIAIVAFVLSAKAGARLDASSVEDKPAPRASPSPDSRAILVLAFTTGFVALAMEVLWTRMLVQVFQNSVYSFSIILATFLSAIVAGSFVARRLAALDASPWTVLKALTMCGGAMVALTPFVFYVLTDGMAPTGIVSGLWWTASIAFLVMFPAGVMLCSAFPFLLKMAEGAYDPGRAIGYLNGANTAGGVLGSLAAGFVLLEMTGLWAAVWVMAALLLIAPVAVSFVMCRCAVGRPGVVALALSVLVLAVAGGLEMPAVHADIRAGEEVVAVFHGSRATVAVVRSGDDLAMKLNNWYVLGSVSGVPLERRLAQIPLLLHPRPRSVFFLGMATGITAGSALSFPVDKVVVCELVSEVAEAAEQHFARYAGGLFTDPRATIVVEDGRTYLSGTNEKFDVIVGDLFLPWASGTGSLFTVEHFRSVSSRMESGGIFAQWLPLYQMSERELKTIVRTALEVFPQVTLWRGSFSSLNPMLALVCRNVEAPLDPDQLVRGARAMVARGATSGDMVDMLAGGARGTEHGARSMMARGLDQLLDALPFTFYVGNATGARSLFDSSRINTDDVPLIEYLAPPMGARAGGELVGAEAANLMKRLGQECPVGSDPYLAKLDARQREYVRAGLDNMERDVFHVEGNEPEAQRRLALYMSRIGRAFERPARRTGPAVDARDATAEAAERDALGFDEASRRLAVILMPARDAPPGAEDDGVCRREMTGIVSALVLAYPDGTVRVTGEMVQRWGVSANDAYARALDNVLNLDKPDVSEYPAVGGMKMALFHGASPMVATRALLIARHSEYVGTGGALVGIPNANALILYPVGDEDITKDAHALAETVDRMATEGEMLLSNRLYWYHDGRFEIVPFSIERGRSVLSVPRGLQSVIKGAP
jgi:spermidine synthase